MPSQSLTSGSNPTRDGVSEAGRTVGRYVLGEEIGRGGMGVVYRAHDPALGRDVALKVLPAHLHRDPERVARLRAEARAASTLDHPHVCTVYEVGEPAPEAGFGPLFVAMALYDGEALDARLVRGPLPVADAAAVAHQVALGLAAAHHKGIVHRDVKPSNVFLTAEGSPGGGPCVKLLDFGVARVEGAPLTRDGATLGTVEYAAPEQAHGEVGPASDQWSVGVLLYEMLAGRRPFDEPYEAALLYAVLNTDPPPLADLRPETPAGLAEIAVRLLEKRPADRFATMDDAAAALAPFAASMAPVAPASGQAWHSARRWVRARQGWRASRWWVAAAALVAVAAATLFVWRMLPDERHVAVLPFAAAGADAEAQAFSDGLVETLTSGLSQLAQFEGKLWVVPASEVRGQNVRSPSAAREMLGATLVVTGSVQRSGGRVRVPLNLVDATSARQLRSTTVEVAEARLNTLPAAVAAALEEMLDLELRPGTAAQAAADAGTESAEAFDALTQGIGYLERSNDPDDTARAIALFERALALDPSYALAHARLGEAYAVRYATTLDERWLIRAEAAARAALGYAPDAAASHILLARVARLRGQTAAAIASARRAIVLEPGSDEAMNELALDYADAGDDARAEQAYLRAIRARPGNWASQNRLGKFYYNAGRYDEAAARFREALRLAPGNAEAMLNLGSVFTMQGDDAAARRLFESSIAAQPSAKAFSNLGTMDYGAGHFDAAVRKYERSLSLDPTDVVVWSNLATTYDTLGRAADVLRVNTEGMRRAEALIAVNPHNAEVQATLASFYADLGRPADARAAAGRAAGLAPAVDVQALLANVYVTLGDAASARRWLRQALAEGYPRDQVEADLNLRRFLESER